MKLKRRRNIDFHTMTSLRKVNDDLPIRRHRQTFRKVNKVLTLRCLSVAPVRAHYVDGQARRQLCKCECFRVIRYFVARLEVNKIRGIMYG